MELFKLHAYLPIQEDKFILKKLSASVEFE
jgi:hypothetical protein